MSTTHTLFLLQEDVAGILVELLEYCDLAALTGVSRDAFSTFQAARDHHTIYLILPDDLQLARRLVYGLHSRGLRRLGRYSSVQVSLPEHVDLLLEQEHPSLTSSEGSIDGLSKLNLADMCVGLYECGQPRILRQEGHPDFTVPATLELPSLCELDFGGTLPAMVYDVSSMPQLQRLGVPTSYLEKTHIPTGLYRVDVRQPPTADQKAELVQQLKNLATIRLEYEMIVDSDSSSVVSTMAKLISIEHAIYQDFDDLAPLRNFEHLKVRLDDTRRQNFSVLRRLPKLVKVTRVPMVYDWYYESFDEGNAAALIAELADRPVLKHFESHQAYTFPLTGLSKIESCRLACDTRNYGWLRTFEMLRIVDVEIGSPKPINLAHITRLEELTVRVSHYGFVIPSAIVAPLVNLRKLAIDGHFYDWSVFLSLTKLTKLSILSPRKRWVRRRQDADGLRGLLRLFHLDLKETELLHVSPLLGLRELRTVSIPEDVDCTPLVESEALPKLVRVRHPHHNCLWSCSYRERRRVYRQNERRREAVEPRE